VSGVILQVWSDPRATTGAQALGPLTGWSNAVVREQRDTAPSLTFAVPSAVADAASLAPGRIVRVLSTARGAQEWLVQRITDTDGVEEGTVRVQCGSILDLLGLRGLVRSGSVTSFPAVTLSPLDLLSRYVTPNLAEDGLDWVTFVTSEGYDDPIAFPAFSRWTRLQVLTTLAQSLGARIDLEVLSGYSIILRAADRDGRAVPRWAVGSTLSRVERTRDLAEIVTAAQLVPAGGSAQPTMWRVDEITGAGPYWVRLQDPRTTPSPAFFMPPGPILEDGQHVGRWIETRGGTAHEILASVAPDQVQVAAITGLQASPDDLTTEERDLVSLVANTTTSAPLTEVTAPSAIAAGLGRIVRDIAAPGITSARQLARDPVFFAHDSAGPPVSPLYYPAVGTCPAVSHRTIDGPTWTAVADGTSGIGDTTVTVRGATGWVYPGEFLVLPASQFRRIGGTEPIRFLDSTTVLPIPITVALDTAITDGQAVSLYTGTLAQTWPARPTSAQIAALVAVDPAAESPTYRLRFTDATTSGAVPPAVGVGQRRNTEVRIKFDAARPVVHAAASFLVRNGHVSAAFGNWDAGSVNTADPAAVVTRRLPAVMLVGNPSGTPTRLAWGMMTPIVAAGGLEEQVVSCSATIAADTTVALAVIPGRADISWQACRWVALWVSDGAGDPAPITTVFQGSGTQLAYQLAQAQLARGARFRLTGVDVRALMDAATPVALNQIVRLAAPSLGVNTDVRIVALEWNLDTPNTITADAGGIGPRLSSVTAQVV
jgi:hypothetical protein